MVGVGSNTPAPYLGATGKTEEGGDTGVVEMWRVERVDMWRVEWWRVERGRWVEPTSCPQCHPMSTPALGLSKWVSCRAFGRERQY